MKTELMNLTPQRARELLLMNTNNRAIRNSRVETLRASFERGEYVLSHQGIAFDEDGTVIDGQHRLTAISLLPDTFSFPMLVTRGLDRESVFRVVDAIQSKRTTADALNVSKPLGETANFLARLHNGTKSGITPTYVAPFVEWVEDEVAELMAFCPTSSKTWSSAPMKAACILQMKTGRSDYAKSIYRAMVLMDIDMMPPVARSMLKSWSNGNVRAAAGSYDLLLRAQKMFDQKFSKLSVVRVADQDAGIAEIRKLLEEEVMQRGAKKKAPASSRGAKSVSQKYFSLLGNAA